MSARQICLRSAWSGQGAATQRMCDRHMWDVRPYPSVHRMGRHGSMVEYWLPYAGHPEGESETAWFRVVDGYGYRTEGNPAGADISPCFAIMDGFAYPTLSMPADAPTFEVVGSFVYTPEGTAWFRIIRAIH